MECLLQYMSAGDAVPLLNACTYFATIQYSMASSSSASHSCAWHSHAFPLQTTAVFKYVHSSTLENSISEQDCKSNKDKKWCALLYMYPHLIITFTSTCDMHSNIFCAIDNVVTVQQKRNGCHDSWSVPHIYVVVMVVCGV